MSSVIFGKMRRTRVSEVRILVISVVASIAVSALAFSDTGQDGRKVVVTGRVVDSLGRPIAGAIAVLVPSHPETSKGPIEYHETDSSGRFQVDAVGPRRSWTLHLISQAPSNTHTTIAPPFSKQMSDDYPAFRGLPVTTSGSGEVDVGDVKIQVYYGSIVIQLLDHSGMPLIIEQDNESRLPDIRLRVRDSKGDVASETGVSSKAFRRSESSIAVTLPQGQWQLELALSSNSMVWLGLPAVTINAAGSPEELTLKLPLGGWRSQTSNAGGVSNSRAAREELERMGLPFTINAFISRVERGNDKAVKLFLAAGMDPDVTRFAGRTALMVASIEGFGEIVDLLLRHGTRVNAKDEHGNTALMFAALGVDYGIVKSLLANGAKVDAKNDEGMTALMYGAASGRSRNVKILLEAGADLTAKDKNGKTALSWATELEKGDVLEVLRRQVGK